MDTLQINALITYLEKISKELERIADILEQDSISVECSIPNDISVLVQEDL